MKIYQCFIYLTYNDGVCSFTVDHTHMHTHVHTPLGPQKGQSVWHKAWQSCHCSLLLTAGWRRIKSYTSCQEHELISWSVTQSLIMIWTMIVWLNVVQLCEYFICVVCHLPRPSDQMWSALILRLAAVMSSDLNAIPNLSYFHWHFIILGGCGLLFLCVHPPNAGVDGLCQRYSD